MKTVFLSLLFCLTYVLISAQYVTIPDENFVVFLQENYPECMDGNQMDTTCTDIVNALFVDCSWKDISDFEGIQYFDSVINLRTSGNLNTGFPVLSDDLIVLIVNYSPNLESLPLLPESLEQLFMSYCPLLEFPVLPEGLKTFDMQNCQSEVVPELPPNLETLIIGNNPIGNYNQVPNTVISLGISNCNMTEMPDLPPNLETLSCGLNMISDLGELPGTLTHFTFHSLELVTIVPELPDSMWRIDGSGSGLTTFTNIPSHCEQMEFENCNLTDFPELPEYIELLRLGGNQISELPPIPESLYSLHIEDNDFYCLPYIPETVNSLSLEGNPFTCLPNYTFAMSFFSFLDDYPICQPEDFDDNPFGCDGADGIEGWTYQDENENCEIDPEESEMQNVSMRLFDDGGELLMSTSTGGSGRYFFEVPEGEYLVLCDTLNHPYTTECEFPGLDSLVVLNDIDSLISNVNFLLNCKPGYDVGVLSAQTDGFIFPGQIHELSINAGDISSFYGMNCAQGVSGDIVVEFDGPVSFYGTSLGSLTPSVDGEILTYEISDFGLVNMFTDFGIELMTDTTAQAGDEVCVQISVNPLSDNNESNNSYYMCYEVVNSYDPNNKLVSRNSVEPFFEDYLYYTINFQNTGNAPAINIRLEDELSGNLNLETFQVVGYSHSNHFDLIDDQLIVYFPEIWLADSMSNEAESKGYFQFRIKPIPGLDEGSSIENTAEIYFDFNEAIVTNTAITNFETIVTVQEAEIEYGSVNIYPNPNGGEFNIASNGQDISGIILYDQSFREMEVRQLISGDQPVRIQMENMSPGLYILEVRFNEGRSEFRRILVE